MASITQYRGKTWRAIVRKTGYKPVSKTFKTKALAQAWATSIEADMNSLRHIDRSAAARKLTVSDLFERFRDEVCPTRKGARWETRRINKLLREAEFVKLRLDQLQPESIREWRDARLKQISAPSVARELSLLSGIFTYAKKEWSAPLAVNPVRLVRRPEGADRMRNRRLGEDEIKRLLEAAGWQEDRQPTRAKEYAGWAMLVAIETAMRLGELTAIRVRDYHPDQRYVALHDTKNGDARAVPLSRRALGLIEVLVQGRNPDDKIFPYTSESLGLYFRELRDAAKLGQADLHFHDTRHEATSRLSKKLANVLELSAVTGHRSLQSLKRYYNPTPDEIAGKLD